MAKEAKQRLAPIRQTVWMLLAALAHSSLAQPAQAKNEPTNLADALLHDSETTLQFRSHYLYRDKSRLADSLAWAGGGWLGYRSGWAGDRLRLGLTAYTSQKLHGPADKDGASLLLAGQRSYTMPGEAYAALKLDDQIVTAGRFLVNRHEVNPQDTRMTPRTFQGVSLAGKVGDIDYFVARLDKMKARNWDDFENVATVAGAPAGVAEPLLLISLRGTPSERLNLGFSSYRVRDVLASTYADAAWLTPLDDHTGLRLNGQYMRQGSTGGKLLTGAAFNTAIIGFKADMIHGPLTLSGIAMQTDRGAAYRMPFGSWAGYTSRIINNFNRAGERVRAVDAVINFAHLDVPGLILTLSATSGNGAINAATGADLSQNAEYNLTADYRFAAATWPQWVQPLWLRARWGRFEQKLGGVVDATSEYHLILNYTVTLKSLFQ